MDDSNKRYLDRMFDDSKHKIYKLLSKDVADPWYTGDFEETYNDLHDGIEKILKQIKEEKSNY